MKKREQGILAVEASMVLTFILLAILFLFGFGRVYRAQSLVSHAVIQTADAVALESYLRETALQGDAAAVKKLANEIAESGSISAQDLESLRSANLPNIAKKKFAVAIESSEARADEKLKNVGVRGGISGIDFSESKMDLKNDDVIIAISYTLEMQFPLFGAKEIPMTKTAKAKTFGEILFEVTTSVNNPGWGTTSGDTKVTHGSTVQITATPNYGYKFKEWSDGNTDPVRTVTVTDAQHYVAIFVKDKFGVNLFVNNAAYGSVDGGGTFEYQTVVTIKAIPKEHYKFVGWDENNDGFPDTNTENPPLTRQITVDKTYNITAIFKPVQYTITVKSNNKTFGSAKVSQGDRESGVSIKADYGSEVLLQAIVNKPKESIYRFVDWKCDGSIIATENSPKIKVEGDNEYVANFDYNTYTVKFYDGDTEVHSTKVIRGSSISASSSVSASWASDPIKTGASFAGWTYNGSGFTNETTVNGNISVYAQWKCTVTFNGNGGTSTTVTVNYGESVNFDDYGSSKENWHFNGWFCNGTQYSGSKEIKSHVTVKASWYCNHKYDDGSSKMYAAETIGKNGQKCSGCKIIMKCHDCSHSEEKNKTGEHKYAANCGVYHIYYYNGPCTGNSENHKWNYARCITCKYCGECKNKTASSHYIDDFVNDLLPQSEVDKYPYIAGAEGKLCHAHNGHNKEGYKDIVNDNAHK